eukprot:g2807.t1
MNGYRKKCCSDGGPGSNPTILIKNKQPLCEIGTDTTYCGPRWLCPEGSEGLFRPARLCQACPSGQYQDRMGATECKGCGPGHTSTGSGNDNERKDLLLPIIRQLISFCMLLGKVGSFQVGAVKAFRLASRYVSEATTGIGLGSYWFTCAVGWSFYGRLFVVAALPAFVAVICFLAVRLQVFEALACTEITFVNGTSVSYLTADFRVSCDDQAYRAARWLAIALVTTHVILPPVMLAVWIRRNRFQLQSAMAIRRVGFLYRGFKLDKYPWWGVVQLVTKVLIAAIVVFLDQELKQMVAATLLFATLLLMQVALRPFAGAVLNKLQVAALMSLTVTQFVPIAVSSFFVANQQDRMQVINEGVATTISIALVAFNGLTIILYRRRDTSSGLADSLETQGG